MTQATINQDQFQAKAIGKMIKGSPQKMNLVAKEIRGLKADQALAKLSFMTRRAAEDTYKVLASAIANAENNYGLDVDQLYVKEAHVGKSMVLRRMRPRARGRVGKILKPYSRITVIVEERQENQESTGAV